MKRGLSKHCHLIYLHEQSGVFYVGFTARQDYFIHLEPSQSLGGAKTGDPREKTPNHPQAGSNP